MTPERAKALEAVAVAASAVCDCVLRTRGPMPINALANALAALDALPAEPADAGEMVEVRLCAGINEDGGHYVFGLTGESDFGLQGTVYGADYEPICMGTIRVPKKRPPLPEVRAEVQT